ncbi:MAG: type 4a pilus biogenesis protein PilO [Candidatus Pacebacteria bacterium]|nr:type 4a pilus biogenesis protein PilO [Candidatus Paceibacterota bacterium]
MPTKRQQVTKTLNEFYQRPVAKVSLELFLSVGAVIFFAVFAIRPTLVTMSDLVKEIEDKKELDQKLTQKIASLSTAQTSYLEVQDRLYLLEQALPSTPDFIHSIKVIEKIASDQDILIDSLSVSEIPREVGLETPFSKLKKNSFPISLSLSGEYSQIRQFVEDLLNYRRSFVTDTVIFSTSEERGQKKLRATITLSVPYFGEKTK